MSGDLPATFVGGSFPGGAIDHITVAGPRAAAFEMADVPDVSSSESHGSDDRPVFTIIRTGFPSDGESPREKLNRLIEEVRERLDEIEGIMDDL